MQLKLIKLIFSIGLFSFLCLPVMAITYEYQMNTGDRPANQIAKSDKQKEKDAEKQREEESGKRRAYRQQKHLELDRDLNEAMKLPKYRNMSQKDKEKLMKDEHDKLDRTLDKKWGYYN